MKRQILFLDKVRKEYFKASSVEKFSLHSKCYEVIAKTMISIG